MAHKQVLIWGSALVLGAFLGTLNIQWLNEFFDFLASAYTRCFQLLAVPTVGLAILTALASLGDSKNAGKIFRKTFALTLLTSFLAALVGLGMYLIVKPGNLPLEIVKSGADVETVQNLSEKPLTVYGHILNAIPNNIIHPLSTGNVLSIILIAAAAGIAIALLRRENEGVRTLFQLIQGLQEVMIKIIQWLIVILPLGIVAFSAQLTTQLSSGVAVGTLGKYILVVLGGNLIQMFLILPLFLICRGLNPLRVFKAVSPALMMALFTKSSAATLPMTISTAENNLKARPAVARFILPLCCTINMNGCAAFIFVTSMFVMQHMPGVTLSLPVMLLWCVVAVLCAVGNAGVPMGCYFLTLSLMAGQGAPLGIMGVILPIYTIIDMIETAENVWSDCCICASVDKSFRDAE